MRSFVRCDAWLALPDARPRAPNARRRQLLLSGLRGRGAHLDHRGRAPRQPVARRRRGGRLRPVAHPRAAAAPLVLPVHGPDQSRQVPPWSATISRFDRSHRGRSSVWSREARARRHPRPRGVRRGPRGRVGERRARRVAVGVRRVAVHPGPAAGAASLPIPPRRRRSAPSRSSSGSASTGCSASWLAGWTPGSRRTAPSPRIRSPAWRSSVGRSVTVRARSSWTCASPSSTARACIRAATAVRGRRARAPERGSGRSRVVGHLRERPQGRRRGEHARRCRQAGPPGRRARRDGPAGRVRPAGPVTAARAIALSRRGIHDPKRAAHRPESVAGGPVAICRFALGNHQGLRRDARPRPRRPGRPARRDARRCAVPNGAGKSTLLRVIATVLSPTYGRGSVLDSDLVRGRDEIRSADGADRPPDAPLRGPHRPGEPPVLVPPVRAPHRRGGRGAREGRVFAATPGPRRRLLAGHAPARRRGPGVAPPAPSCCCWTSRTRASTRRPRRSSTTSPPTRRPEARR